LSVYVTIYGLNYAKPKIFIFMSNKFKNYSWHVIFKIFIFTYNKFTSL